MDVVKVLFIMPSLTKKNVRIIPIYYFLKELLGYNADIMCLQEVDKKIYDGDLSPVFSQHGFDGVFDLKGGVVTY